MPPHNTQISCPQCGQPIVAMVEQLFDVTSDPSSKQRLLGGISNYAICRACGFNGPLSTPIVYHDNAKELLLTYFPAELRMSLNEQEKTIGPLITQITSKLPAERRKGYLLQPQGHLTYQGLIEHILESDGITKEMIKGQQNRLKLVEKLLSVSTPEGRSEIIKQDSNLFDAEFFAIFARIAESAIESGQEQAAKQIAEIQHQLFEETSYGKSLASHNREVQEALKTLQTAGKTLDRDKLIQILIDAPSDDRLTALVSFTRPGLDYLFFQALTERIERSDPSEQARLEILRGKLLEITRMIDKQVEAETNRANNLLETIMESEDVAHATTQNIADIGDVFIQVLNMALEEANRKNDTTKMPKLQKIVEVLQKMSAPPPELQLLNEFLDTSNEAELLKMIDAHKTELTPALESLIADLMTRMDEKSGKESSDNKQLVEKLQWIYRLILRYKMRSEIV